MLRTLSEIINFRLSNLSSSINSLFSHQITSRIGLHRQGPLYTDHLTHRFYVKAALNTYFLLQTFFCFILWKRKTSSNNAFEIISGFPFPFPCPWTFLFPNGQFSKCRDGITFVDSSPFLSPDQIAGRI